MKQQLRSGCAVALTLFCTFMPGASSEARGQTREKVAAEAFTASDHWSREALRRLSEAGLLDPASVLASWPMRSSDVRGLLERAVANSERSQISALRGLAHTFLQAFDDEYGNPAERSVAFAARLAEGWDARTGTLRAGTMLWTGYSYLYPGPSPLGDVSTPFALATISALPARWLTASVSGQVGGSASELRETYVAGRLGDVDVWGGRRGLGFGTAHGESIVLSDGALFDGGGIEDLRGFKLPGFLGALGPVRGTTLLARMKRSGLDLRPWFAAMRVTLQPAQSLSIGLNRATMFGGSTNPVPTNARTIFLMFLGYSDVKGKDSDFENQVASIDLMWRLRAGRVPVAVYGEYGVDDTGRAFLHVPGWVAGAEIPSLPGMEAVSIGLEHTKLPHSCCGYPPWYQHGPLADGWTDRGTLLGSSLGGEGSEWTVRWRYDAPRAALAGGNVFTRVRGVENLLSPTHGGRSAGGAMQLVVRGTRRFRIKGAMELERGHDWWNKTATLGTELTF